MPIASRRQLRSWLGGQESHYYKAISIGCVNLGASALLAFALNRLFELLRNDQADLPDTIPHIGTQQNVAQA